MKNNQNDQANDGKSGGKANQKSTQPVGKKENAQQLKKGNADTEGLDPEEMEEGTTTPESKGKKTEGKTGNKKENW